MKKKVLQVVNIPFVLPYYFGDQIEFLKDIDLDITIACSPGAELDRFCDKYQIQKEGIDIVRKIDPITDLSSLIKLIKLIKKEKFDYVIGHTPKGGLLAMLAARLTGVKHRIYFRHGIVYETSKGFKRKLMVALEKVTSMCATKIVSVSKSVLLYSQNAGVNRPEKNILLNQGTCNGIDFKRFKKQNTSSIKESLNINAEDRVIGFVGRLVNDKGIEELIDGWKIVKKHFTNVKLLLVGPFEERDALQHSIRDYILTEPSIVFTDFVENTVPYYNIMDIFILPSYREGFPTVVLEASAMEIPVITTRSTGCIDSIVENQTGIFTAISGNDISKKILYYLENENIRKKHGRTGRQWVEQNFDQYVVWDAIKTNVFDK